MKPSSLSGIGGISRKTTTERKMAKPVLPSFFAIFQINGKKQWNPVHPALYSLFRGGVGHFR